MTAAAPDATTWSRAHFGQVWRVPIDDALGASGSAYVDVVRKRAARGDKPDVLATVWTRGGLWFAHISFEQPLHAALIIQLHDWRGRVTPPGFAATFGKRTTPP